MPLQETESLFATPPATAAPAHVWTVGTVVLRLKKLVEDAFASALWIEGEVSNCKYYPSGHIYFDLVDEQATDRRGQRLLISCVFWKTANQSLKFKITDGLKVLCLGRLGTYEARSQYQFSVLQMQPKGQGALQLAFEQMKKRLAAEGLFDEARKRPIPRMPERVGIVTSRAGSAIHDMVSKLKGRFHVIVMPVKVQGEGAAADIAAAIELANARQLTDVLIVGRGGGSVEDLWAFNEEPVARAIFRSKIPVISAVGHQDDWTIADYVADKRASTPTDAAKLLVNEQQLLLDEAADLVRRLTDTMDLVLERACDGVEALCHRLRLLHPMHQLTQCEARVAEWQANLVQGMRHWFEREDRQLQGLAGRLQALSPLAVLARGYSITRQLPVGHVITSAERLKPGDQLETLLAKGRVRSTVNDTLPINGHEGINDG